ncbi:hypothetical protein EUA72_00430 [TM7 phylum sp. oral taxon 352]|nr:hypothetical protein EUA72_00430 [TM7 phylum sp. oral taxon 352]
MAKFRVIFYDTCVLRRNKLINCRRIGRPTMLPNDAPIATATPMRIARAKIARAGRKFALFGGYRTPPINQL